MVFFSAWAAATAFILGITWVATRLIFGRARRSLPQMEKIRGVFGAGPYRRG
jgi:flagellar biogenesis protein FliO